MITLNSIGPIGPENAPLKLWFPDLLLIYKFEHLEKRNQQIIEYVARGTRKLTSLWVK